MAFPKVTIYYFLLQAILHADLQGAKKTAVGQFESSVRSFVLDPRTAPKSNPMAAPKTNPMDIPSATWSRAAPIAAPKHSPRAVPKLRELLVFDM
jgi:hypothetical protein